MVIYSICTGFSEERVTTEDSHVFSTAEHLNSTVSDNGFKDAQKPVIILLTFIKTNK